uniref:Uncharacterized protein n=1 Tax=Populus trichocarpa TaxID=3694 RepID=A0A2K1R648_POPTR
MDIEVVLASSSPTLLSIPSHSSTSSRCQIQCFFNLGKAVTLAISPSLIPKNPQSNLLTFNELNTRLSRLGNLPNGGNTSTFVQ